MTIRKLLRCALLLAPLLAAAVPAVADDGYRLWLRYTPVADAARLREYRGAITSLRVEGDSPTLAAARRELTTGLGGLLGSAIPVGDPGDGTVLAGTPASSPRLAALPLAAELGRLGPEGYLVRAVESGGRRLIVIAANRDIGVLYGAFALLRHLQTQQPLDGLSLEGVPKLELRMLNHWDNPNGSIERGYAGRTLWKWSQLPDTLDPRYVDYARANASIGVNAVSLTNVNANTIFLTPAYIAKAAALANVFRPYGIRVFLTARFSSPVELGGLPTADPLDPAVQAWWRQKANEVYAQIPDFGGFLMKANSEGQPGPRDYDRSHAEGANLIADALAPHGGMVIWRAFVYANHAAIDRVKQAYDEFTPLDGQFRPNVFIQVKNGPLDFQPREPFSPLFGAMPKTPLMMELQITKEYLGQYSSLVYLGTMWTEVLHADTYAHGPGSTVARMLDGTLTKYPHTGIAGVANTGDDRNWSGSSFNQANWYAFGRLAWDHSLGADAIAEEWIRMTYTNDASFVGPVKAMLLNSREAAVNYMMPLGLAHLFNGGGHYGPGPWDTAPPRADWTPPYYHRADSLGIGFDRTASGSNAVAQYHPPLDRLFADRATVGDTLLLWFHRVGWTERLPSGRTLWEELVRHYNMGVDTVQANLRTWTSLAGKIDAERFAEARADLEKEVAEAKWWRDASLRYWQTFSKLPIPAGYEQPAHPLEFYQRLRCPTDLIHSSCPEVGAMPRGGQAAPADAPYRNPALPVAQRVRDLVSRMTLAEKVSQLRDHAAAIPRLGVPSYVWWNEAAHGVMGAGHATVFPQVIALGATWDTRLVQEIGEAISTEGRAKYHQAIRDGNHDWFYGLTFWAPNINIFRDPRWGRGQETYGEDPFLTGRMAVAFVKGMQGNDPKYLKVVATPKHYAVHSGPEPLRHHFNVNVAPHDLEDTYLPAFRAAVIEGRAESVMCAYNAIDGLPACASSPLLRETLRTSWGFSGYLVSDCGAISDVTTGHKYAPDPLHAAVVSLKAGTDLECGWGDGAPYAALARAVQQGLVTPAEIDTALVRLFTARFRLGMFDPPESYAYGRIPFAANNSPEHRALALRAARAAMVLLENDGTLPLAANGKRIAVIGPTADLVQALQGNYNGTPLDPVSPIAGMIERYGAANIAYAQGSVLAEGLAIPVARSALRSGAGAGLKGEYFANAELAGEPVEIRVDPVINFNWDKAVPLPGLPRNDFSVRWTGTFTPPAAGDYRLGARVRSGRGPTREIVRVYLDGRLVVDNGQLQGALASSPDTLIRFADVRPHDIRIEYLSRTSSAGIDLTWQPPADVLSAEAVATARQADVVVAFLGISPQLEGEEMPVDLPGFKGGDRTDIALPLPQRELLAALAATGKPVVLVLTSGSALVADDAHANAILQAWYPGVEGGTAIAETIAGDNNPAGRLPLTFYASVEQLPPFEDYAMANRTYRYFAGRPWRGFGYGLSYSKFAYSGLTLPARPVAAGEPVVVEVDVKNVSEHAGDEVVQLYLTHPKQALTPSRTLAGFTRVPVEPGQTVHVRLQVDARSLGQVDASGARTIVPGEYGLAVGGTQPGDSEGGVSGTFTVRGPAKRLPR